MGDLIERDAAHDAIGFERCDRSCTDCPTKCTWLYTVKNIPAVNRWIPVEDALPEKDKSYITYAETTKYCNHNELPEESRINILYFNGEEWYDEECRYYNVTYYMPLPEPPKE